VAWIDILGLSAELQNARTTRDFARAHKKVHFVQRCLEHPPTTDNPKNTRWLQGRFREYIIALSDGLVLAQVFDTPRTFYPFDLAMEFIEKLLNAQAECVINGYFLRGAVTMGTFYFKNDILLSPALVAAYKLETERSYYPVIIINRELVANLRRLPGHENHPFDWSICHFRPFKSPRQKSGERFDHLHYLGYLVTNPNVPHVFSDQELDRALGEKLPPTVEGHRDIYKSRRREVMKLMATHKKCLLQAYAASSTDRVRAKYRWLFKYHNRLIDRLPTDFRDHVINF
jgi:hypothetical protein